MKCKAIGKFALLSIVAGGMLLATSSPAHAAAWVYGGPRGVVVAHVGYPAVRSTPYIRVPVAYPIRGYYVLR
jgi:hypothetical protein